MEKTSPPLHIAFGIDSNFLCPMCVTAVSILENNPDIAIEFHVFAFSFPKQDQEILKLFENQYHTPFHLHLIDENIFSQLPPPKKKCPAIASSDGKYAARSS